MKERGKDGCDCDEPIRLDSIKVFVVAGFEFKEDAVEDVAGKECGCVFLKSKDDISSCVVGQVALHMPLITLQTMNSTALIPKITVQQMKVSRESPVTDLDLLIFNTINANPKVCTVPASVKISENCPSLNTKYRMRMMMARITQYSASYFLNAFIIITNIIILASTKSFQKFDLFSSTCFAIIIMKEQFETSRQELINHIEAKLAQLKNQRDSLLKQPNLQTPSDKIKISNYLQNQNKQQPQSKAVIKANPNYDACQPQLTAPSKKQILQSRLNARQNCQVLKDLYERKRQLESVGIYETNPQKIKQIYANQTVVSQINKTLIKNNKKASQREEKQKIIQQQLTKVEAFLKQSKKSSKSASSRYFYTELLKGQQAKLLRFDQLLSKGKLSLVEKDELLEMSFELLKEYPERVSKKALQEFLLANDSFCKIFLVTKEQIMRDLQVHKTNEPNFLTYHQFYEFIKSIEITNKAIKPNLKYAGKQPKPTKKDNYLRTSSPNKADKAIEEYLKKVFLYLDQRRQKIVERQRLEIAIAKCLLFDEKKMKSAHKETIINLAQFIRMKRKLAGEGSHFKNLDLKYIGLEELLELYRAFIRQSSKKSQQSQATLSDAPDNQSTPIQSQSQSEENIFQTDEAADAPEVPKQTTLHEDFQKFGWGDSRNDKQSFSQLRQLDGYYKEVGSKYGNQIHWNQHNVYQEDFRKFNQCIAQLKSKHDNSSKDIVGLKIEHPVYEQEEEHFADDQ